MKVTGAQIKDFWDNGWPNGYYYEPEGMPVDDEYGNFDLELSEKYDLSDFGFLVPNDWRDDTMISFSSAYMDWHRSQVEIDDDSVGFRIKYIVTHLDSTPLSDGFVFVLRPDRDSAAWDALAQYSKSTKNEKLSQDLQDWLNQNSRPLENE